MDEWRDATHPVLKNPCRCWSVVVRNAGAVRRIAVERERLLVHYNGGSLQSHGWKERKHRKIDLPIEMGEGEWGMGETVAVELLESAGSEGVLFRNAERVGMLRGLKWLGNNHQRSLGRTSQPAPCEVDSRSSNR